MRTGNWSLLLVLVLLLGLAFMPGCSGDDDDDDDSGKNTDDDDDDDDDDTDEPLTYEETCEEGSTLAFDMTTTPMVVPYPNNLYTVPDDDSWTGRRLQIDGNTALPMGRFAGIGLFNFLTKAINTLNGFSTLADLYLPVGETPSEASFPDHLNPGFDQSIFLMVDDPNSEHNGELAPINARLLNGIIHLRPAYALRENTDYILVATRNLLPEAGGCYKASSGIQKIWTANANDLQTDSNTAELAASFANLESLGFDTLNVLSISKFSTLVVTKGLNDARKALDKLAQDSPPAMTNFEYYGLTNPALMPHVDRYAYATLSMPMFKSENGEWERDSQGNLNVQSWEDVEVLITLPKDDLTEASQPYPLVLYGHGLGDVKESLSQMDLGDTYAEHGFALMGIDNICHGARAPIPSSSPYILAYEALICYFNPINPLAMRDRFRESIANQMWLARAAQQLGSMDVIPEGGDGIPDFDVSNLYFTGVSMGAIQGGLFSAMEESIEGWVLSSAGAKWMGVAFEGPYFGMFLDIAVEIDKVSPGLNAEELLWMFSHILQNLLDVSEPANFLPHTISDPFDGLEGRNADVLQQGAEADYTIGGMSGAYACRAGGWPQLEPYVWDVEYASHEDCPISGSGFYQYDTDEHLALWDSGPIGDAYRAQAIHFLKTKYETGTGVIIDPYD